MCLLSGNSQLESGDYDGAIQSFERSQMRYHTSWPFLVVSLVSFSTDVLQCIDFAHRVLDIRLEI